MIKFNWSKIFPAVLILLAVLLGIEIIALRLQSEAEPETVEAASEEETVTWGAQEIHPVETVEITTAISPPAISAPEQEKAEDSVLPDGSAVLEESAEMEVQTETAPTEAVPEGTPTPNAVTESPHEAETAGALGMDALNTQLQTLLSGYSGTWSVYVYNLDTGERVSIGEQSLVAASLIKLYVAGTYCQAVENGTLADNYGNDLSSMLSQSDNSACNRLIRALGNGDAAAGMAAVNQFSAEMGYSHSQLNREMLAASPPENYTSTGDCGALLTAVYQGTFVSAQSSQRILNCLLAQERKWKIPAGVPAGVQTANKTGELSNVENDAAIVWGTPCTYVLCVMSNNISPGTAQKNIQEISALVYDSLNP